MRNVICLCYRIVFFSRFLYPCISIINMDGRMVLCKIFSPCSWLFIETSYPCGDRRPIFLYSLFYNTLWDSNKHLDSLSVNILLEGLVELLDWCACTIYACIQTCTTFYCFPVLSVSQNFISLELDALWKNCKFSIYIYTFFQDFEQVWKYVCLYMQSHVLCVDLALQYFLWSVIKSESDYRGKLNPKFLSCVLRSSISLMTL